MLRGETNSKILEKKKINIWKENSSREFLDKRNLDYEEGELGPIYGFQWRNFGGEYPLKYGGVDQIKYVLDLIKTDPTSRRILLSSWNARDLEKMSLPPCHCLCQFHVFEGRLSCKIFQRSCDVALGLPFNIPSYALLCHIIAKKSNLKPEKLFFSFGDVHIYKPHVEILKEICKRESFPPPKIILKDSGVFEEMRFEDFELLDYKSHKSEKISLCV